MDGPLPVWEQMWLDWRLFQQKQRRKRQERWAQSERGMFDMNPEMIKKHENSILKPSNPSIYKRLDKCFFNQGSSNYPIRFLENAMNITILNAKVPQ